MKILLMLIVVSVFSSAMAANTEKFSTIGQNYLTDGDEGGSDEPSDELPDEPMPEPEPEEDPE